MPPIFAVRRNTVRRTGKQLDADANGTVDRKTAWVWDGQQVVMQLVDADGAGAGAWKLTNRYLYGDAVDLVLADEQLPSGGIGLTSVSYTTGNVLWPLFDQLGSVRDVVDSNGVIRQHLVFDSFGNRLSETDYNTSGVVIPNNDPAAVDELFGYTGREWDSDVKLQYNRARWYDPAQGRWISQDPIGFGAGDVNLYRYVGNGVTGGTDPSGLEEYNRYAWHWHHLLTKNEFSEDFIRRHGLQGLDINSEQFGWMLQAKDHIECGGGIHPAGWSDDWVEWIKRKERAGIRITPGMIRGKLAHLMGKYGLTQLGHAAEMPYQVWQLGDEARAAYRAAKTAGNVVAERAARKAAAAAELATEKATKRAGKKGSKLIPGISTFVAIGFYAEDVQARGVVCGSINSGLDAVPWLSSFKAATELASGEDWIPDKATQAARAEFWRRYNEQLDFYRTIEEEYRRDHDPWGWGR